MRSAPGIRSLGTGMKRKDEKREAPRQEHPRGQGYDCGAACPGRASSRRGSGGSRGILLDVGSTAKAAWYRHTPETGWPSLCLSNFSKPHHDIDSGTARLCFCHMCSGLSSASDRSHGTFRLETLLATRPVQSGTTPVDRLVILTSVSGNQCWDNPRICASGNQ